MSACFLGQGSSFLTKRESAVSQLIVYVRPSWAGNKRCSGEYYLLGAFTEQLHTAELVSFVLKASGEVDKVMIYRSAGDIPQK